MVDPQLNTRVDEEVRESVEEYAEREQTNKSTAVRQFLVAGMDQFDELPDGVERPQATQTQTDPAPSFVEALATRQAAGLAVLPFILGCTVFAAGAPFANSPVAAAAVLLVGGALLVTSTAAVWAVALAHVTLHGLPSVLAVGGGADG